VTYPLRYKMIMTKQKSLTYMGCFPVAIEREPH
jgi:hypothetical protein